MLNTLKLRLKKVKVILLLFHDFNRSRYCDSVYNQKFIYGRLCVEVIQKINVFRFTNSIEQRILISIIRPCLNNAFMIKKNILNIMRNRTHSIG